MYQNGRTLKCGYCLVALLMCSTAGAANEETQARAHYDRAIQLYGDGAYDAALAELNRAWELRPSYKLIYNMAQIQSAMKDYARALSSYRRYLMEGGDEIASERRAAVEQEMQTLQQRVASFQVHTDVPHAEVLVDGEVVGRTPDLSELLVNAGMRTIGVRHPDYPLQSQRIAALGGSAQTVTFSLAQGGEPVTEARSPDAVREPAVGALLNDVSVGPRRQNLGLLDEGNDGQLIEPWVAWTATGVLAATAAGTGLAALMSSNALADRRDQVGASATDLQARADSVSTLALVSDVFWVATLASAGLSLWLTVDSDSGHATADTQAWHALNVRVSPMGVAFDGRF